MSKRRVSRLERPTPQSRKAAVEIARSSATTGSTEEAAALAQRAAGLALIKKAVDVVVIDLTGLATVCDYFVVCHGDSDVQVKAIADSIVEGLHQEGTRVWHVEGYSARKWVLLDYVDIVVHVFHRETRQFYRLEDLWADAPRETVSS